jgi:hypothetical protein
VYPRFGTQEIGSGQRKDGLDSASFSKASPGPVLRSLHEPSCQCVPFDVPASPNQAARFFDQVRFVSTLIDRALANRSSMGVEPDGMGSFYPMHQP